MTLDEDTELLLVGKGRAGTSLHHVLGLVGIVPQRWWSRRDGGAVTDLPAADVIMLAVSDDAIAEVARGLATRPSASSEVWLHLSGSLPASVLRVSSDAPKAAGGFHVLQALDGSAVGLDHVAGVTAGLDGDADALALGAQLATKLGMVPRRLAPGTKALYHAAAVSVAGHAMALFAQAQSMLAACGLDEAASRAMLQPLMAGAVRNLKQGPPSAVVTGPMARGDADVIAAHLEAIDGLDTSDHRTVAATYRLLARSALELSHQRLDAEQIGAIERLLEADWPAET